MSDFNFILCSLKSRWLNCLLSILLTAFGLSIALLITQLGNHVQERLTKDGKGIDLVVGAKGSPLQLVLSSVYHFDIPTGNISYSSAKKLTNHPQIKSAIPLALGDNWNGYRIVGTSRDYLTHYNAIFDEGQIWEKDFQVVAGADTGLNINQEIIGAHGLIDKGAVHHDHIYTVKGILKPSGTVLDRLILTSLDSVLKIHNLETTHSKKKSLSSNNHEYNENDHGHKEDDHEHIEHNHESNEHDHESKDEKVHNHESSSAEITAFLITTNSPVANINLPRKINKETQFQAANPAIEMTRLTSALGLGSKSFAILSLILILIASLSIFSGLAANLENRLGDLAILRALGYSKNRIFRIVCIEGIIIILGGITLGLILGFSIFSIFVEVVAPLSITQASFSVTYNSILLIISVFLSGLLASVFPAFRASKISVAKQLSQNI